jgi:F-type H+-transporting ATPase subunit b
MDDFGVTLVPDVTILLEVAVFLIVLAVVSRYVLPRIQAAVVERQRLVSDVMAAAEATEARATTVEARAEASLRAARQEARRIIDDAYERRDHLIKEGIRKGREEYDWFTRPRTAAQSSPEVLPNRDRAPRAPARLAP